MRATVTGDEGDAPQYTPDGHHIIVGQRRWRATDPAIPEKLRAELVAELSAARRAVKDDPTSARGRVQDAKVALGERGRPWWETATEDERLERLTATIRALLRRRHGSSICPSDAARVAGGERWRPLVPEARSAAIRLRDAGIVVITQRGREVTGDDFRGPLRIAPGDGLWTD